MLIGDRINIRSNVHMTFRERGKKVAARDGHNMWVTLGSTYLSRVVTPTATWEHLAEGAGVIKYMGVGIGGVYGTDVVGQLANDYPGQHTYEDDDSLTPVTLERPVKLTGSGGRASTNNTWLNTITVNGSTPSFFGTPTTNVEFICSFDETDVGLGGVFASVPLTEVGLFLSNQISNLTTVQVYDYNSIPTYIQTTRQQQVAYFPFEPISKTPSISIEVRWQLLF